MNLIIDSPKQFSLACNLISPRLKRKMIKKKQVDFITFSTGRIGAGYLERKGNFITVVCMSQDAEEARHGYYEFLDCLK